MSGPTLCLVELKRGSLDRVWTVSGSMLAFVQALVSNDGVEWGPWMMLTSGRLWVRRIRLYISVRRKIISVILNDVVAMFLGEFK